MGACVSECMDATRVVLTNIFSSLLVTRKGRARTRRVRGAGAGVHGSRDTTRHPAPHESINAHRRRGSPVEGNASPLPTTLHLPAGVSSPFAFRPNPKKKDCCLFINVVVVGIDEKSGTGSCRRFIWCVPSYLARALE